MVFVSFLFPLSHFIFRHPPAPLLSFLPDCINFGSQVCAHQSVTHSLTIINTGSAVGSFSLTAHHLPSYLTITPLKGTVSPDSQEHINVSMMICTYLLHSTCITVQYLIIHCVIFFRFTYSVESLAQFKKTLSK